MRFHVVWLLLCWFALVSPCRGTGRPNFIIIFTDDQGYNDLGCFGSPNIRTPNIDRMASEGMRLTSFYSGASVCTPSRAALLTGCYPERVGNLGVLFPNSDRGLNPEETTTAEMLRQHGYATACFGKWHLGHHQAFLPTEHGFDEYFGIPYSNDMGVDGSMELAEDIKLLNGHTIEDFRADAGKAPPLMRDKLVIEWPADQTQLTRRYTEQATRFITEHAKEPFFVYLPHTMPHIPLYASDRFRGKSDAGLYGDTLEEIDWSVGEILKTLKNLKIDDHTMVVYTSDNGPWNLKGNDTDKVKGNMNRRIGGSAYPLRGHKFSKWEGGMRVPCVMRWPGRIPAGTTCDEITASIDLLPTIVELSGASESLERIIDGKSIVPLLEGQANARTPHETYFYRTSGVRSGKWKFINGQLFDLEVDIAESTNLAEQYPDVANRLKQLLEDHKADMKANGRPPAYFERPAHPLKGLDGWTVQSGRWNLHKGKTLRQRSDWTNAEAVSPKLPGAAMVVEVEAKLIDAQGGFGLALLEANSQHRISLALGAEGNTRHVLKATNSDQTVTIPGSIDATQWHRIRLSITETGVIASVNGKRIGELKLGSAVEVQQIALTGSRSKAEYRNLRVKGKDGIVLLEALTVAGQEQAHKPNIVIFLGDDVNYCDLGCYGNPEVKTPTMDRLAREGIRFTRAYTATAMCGPTRMQLYTGIYPVRSGGFPNHSRVKEGTKSIVHHLTELGYRVALSNKSHVGPKESFPFEIIKGMDVDGWRAFMTRDSRQPFCIAICSSQPHEPWDHGDASQYEPGKITVPPFMFDNQETREALCRYYGEITYLDQELDSCLKILEKEGLEENTLVLFSSEQGAGVPNSKWTCYDLGLRVALVARWPKMIQAGSTTDAMVNYVDVVPTLLDLMGTDLGQYDFDGTSFKDVLLGKSNTHNRYAYGVHTQTNAIGAPKTGYPVRSVRNERYKYIINENSKVMFSDHLVVADPERFFFSWREAADAGNRHAKKLVDKYLFRPLEELYDLEQDPYELNNLIATPRHAETLQELKGELKKWMVQQGDQGHETELNLIRKRNAEREAKSITTGRAGSLSSG